MHVTLGILWLLTLVGMSRRGQMPIGRSSEIEVAGLYWHFVDVVWIVIFTIVYLVPN
jgi:cytochrome c oxidase subunit 3/cytochrome o ubiquinol oxidase subunit 3